MSSVADFLCDQSMFEPLKRLIEGPFRLGDVQPAERIARAIVLHDDAQIVPQVNVRSTAEGEPFALVTYPPFNSFGLLRDGDELVIGPEEVKGSFGEIREVLEEAVRAGLTPQSIAEDVDGAVAAVWSTLVYRLSLAYKHLKNGGSVIMEHLVTEDDDSDLTAASLFANLDSQWQQYAKDAMKGGFDLTVPPVLGIALTRCARRDAIPASLRDLRDEWAPARRKVWRLLNDLKSSKTIGHANEIRSHLKDASKQFALEPTDSDTRPVRVFWDIAAGAAAGAVIGALSGGRPLTGAVTAGLGQLARPAVPVVHEFGPALFGRGAFDLARRVRREVSKVELECAWRLLSEAERGAFSDAPDD